MGRISMLVAAAGLVVALAVPALAPAGGVSEEQKLHAFMEGSQEVPAGSGDPNGVGEATITLRRQARRVCHDMTWSNIRPAKAGHIHRGRVGVDGPIVVELFSGRRENGSQGCTDGVSRALITALREHPRRFYVNIHNNPFPDGAIRGQLSQQPPF
jgi:hypothetical protein